VLAYLLIVCVFGSNSSLLVHREVVVLCMRLGKKASLFRLLL
jgi:hypothetical protein